MTTEVEPEIIQVSVTCRTVGCLVVGVTYTAIPVQVQTTGERLRVICGQCGNRPEIVE